MSDAGVAGPESVINAFVDAWNTHDIDAFDRLFTDDAVWVAVAELRVVGRPAIVADFAEIHTTWASAVTVAASDVTIRSLRPDVAVVFFHTNYIDDGVAVPGIDRAMIMTAVRESGRWLVAAGQVTKEAR